jgi:hypothetical protein
MVIDSSGTKMSSDDAIKQLSGQGTTTSMEQARSRTLSESSTGEGFSRLEVFSIVNSQPRSSDISDADTSLACYNLQFALAEVKSVKKVHPHLSWPFLSFSLKSDEFLPSLYFHTGGMKDFWKLLQRFLCLSK